jgi:uncharacterized protein
MTTSYLLEGLPRPVASPDGLDSEFWEAATVDVLKLQYCRDCHHFQWGPEWICHRCRSFQVEYRIVEPTGVIYSYERVWHPVHPALREQGPYIVVLVALPHADQVRMVGNLLGDPRQEVTIGSAVRGQFEHHPDASPPYSLLQWAVV